MTQELLTANHAAATAAVMAARANRFGRGFCSGVYPITPQSESIELLSQLDIEKGSVVRVESEHSAMAVCIGGALGGARTYTASSANGLAFMAENVFAAGLARLPIVMMAVNRTLGPPWNIWAEHADTLMLRDSGWLQLYCEDNQEVFDSIVAAFRLAEDHRIMLPVMVNQDAFVLSHTMMQIDLPDQKTVDEFLPVLDLPHRLSDKPRVVGQLDLPHDVEVHRQQMADAMARVPEVYAEVQDAFEAAFGRRLADPVVPYRMEDAEVVLVSMGTMAATARLAVDAARERGIRAGALRVRMFRPLPLAPFAELLGDAKRVAIIDRDISPGLGGVLWGELHATAARKALVQGYMMGLGGGDIRPQHLEGVIDDIAGRGRAGEPHIVEVS
ncbi:MAG: pyruvate ferredoxin oxidoreductase [Deltaproteobacteria bacterium]|jgi:pyruvate/2-oxoacid:ferredoxin oxidoreductase alpha subunit|nr:pyruvate ferredoxin oxidoreductase [Deltaproteobacteria bacterium]MBW2533781.1 pyruvate ferredoxin oxidoreductase [Deltaproteobacteria bacterium]